MTPFDAFYYLVLVIAWSPIWAPAALGAACWATRARRDPWDTAAAQLVRDAAEDPAVDTDAIDAFHASIRGAQDLDTCYRIWPDADNHITKGEK